MWFNLLGRMKDSGLRNGKQESEDHIGVIILLLYLFNSQVFDISAEIDQFEHNSSILDVIIQLILFLYCLKNSCDLAYAYDRFPFLINMHDLLLHLEEDIYHIFKSLALDWRIEHIVHLLYEFITKLNSGADQFLDTRRYRYWLLGIRHRL